MSILNDDQPSVHFVHRLLRARDWQDRPEFARLCDWWRDDARGICELVGIGGSGKTAIADRFLRVIPGVTADAVEIPKDETLRTPNRVHFASTV